MNEMNEAPQHQMVADVARALIEQVAPQEMPLFRATSAAYFKNPRRALRGQSDRDEMLGFGAGEGAAFVTPIALIAAARLVEFVEGPAAPAPRRGLSGLVSGLMKKPRERDDQRAVQPLTPERAAQARDLVLQTLQEHGFPEDKREAAADALLRSLPTAGA